MVGKVCCVLGWLAFVTSAALVILTWGAGRPDAFPAACYFLGVGIFMMGARGL